MQITPQKEPNYSAKQLKKFENKYGYNSEYFYEHYRQNQVLIEDEYEASKWAFEYEVNRRAKEIESSQLKEDFINEGEHFSSSSLLFLKEEVA